jgi:hypothetical protein
MRTLLVVMSDPLLEDSLQMPFVEWNQEVEAFPPYSPDDAFTKSIRLWCTQGRFQHLHSQCFA